jgi:hypothetical protein
VTTLIDGGSWIDVNERVIRRKQALAGRVISAASQPGSSAIGSSRAISYRRPPTTEPGPAR